MRLVPALLVLLVVAIAGAVLPLWIPPFYVRVVQVFFFSATLAIAWNLLGGFAGYWSFGHTVFIGLGAFAAAQVVGAFGLTSAWAILIAVLGAGAISAAFAALIAYPILRLRGIYFAIAMLGVGQALGEVINNVSWFQGGIGVFLPSAVPDGMPPERYYYYVFGGFLLTAFVISFLVRRSRFGHGLLAIREDEDTARMLGVPTEQFKIAAFVLSAAIIGMTGAVYGYSLGYFTTYSVFRIDFSLNMIVYCLIGGIGTLLGPIIGTAIMLVLTQVVLGRLLDLHLLVTGLVVVVIVLAMPNGVLGFLHALPGLRRGAARSAA